MSALSTNLPKGYEQYSLPTMGAEQKSIYDLLSGVFKGGAGQGGLDIMGQLASGDPTAFAQREAPAMRQFEEQILPGIAGRFAGKGTLKSSMFERAAAGAGGSLAESLASQRQDIQQQAMQQLMSLGKTLLGTPTEQYGLVEKPQTDWAGLLSQLGVTGLEMIPGMAQASSMGKLASSLSSRGR